MRINPYFFSGGVSRDAPLFYEIYENHRQEDLRACAAFFVLPEDKLENYSPFILRTTHLPVAVKLFF